MTAKQTTQPMQTIVVETARQTASYPIDIQPGLLSEVGAYIKKHVPKATKVLLVTDETVDGLYAEQVINTLNSAGLTVDKFVIPAGESSKCFAQAQAVFDQALSMGLSRQDVMLALGGGVAGDLTGYCAATYYRGTQFVQVPTTLLAQVDSSVGGKVAINYKTAKNGIGAFYQPAFVLIDPTVLDTLAERELKAGMAEVIKYSLIEESCTGKNPGEDRLFNFLQTNISDLKSQIGEVIARCCQIKQAVVIQDELDQKGLRAFLNLGHTFGHAYEALTGYTEILHGEAVAMGLLKACALSEKLGIFPAADTEKFRALFDQLGLPAEPPNCDVDKVLALMRTDKKAEADRITVVLPTERIGKVVLRNDVPDETIASIL